MAKMQAKFENSSRHEEVKSADRIGKKSRARTLTGKKFFSVGHVFFSLLIHFV